MSRHEPRSWSEDLLAAALLLLASAFALNIAGRLIEAVWPALVGIGIAAALVAAARYLRQ